MLPDMKGQVAIVTGASEGIGLATARLLASRGARVAICARRPGPLEEARAEIGQAGEVEAHQLDVSDLSAYVALIEDIAARHGRLDMLVNNAMAEAHVSLQDTTLDIWRRNFAVNADAIFVSTQAAVKIMSSQDFTGRQRGAIVNIASICGVRAPVNMSAYNASKAAMIQFSTSAAMEVAPLGIRVNCVVPGLVQTPAGKAFSAGNPDLARRIEDAIPMKRGGDPDELADAILFMLSDAASYITGHALLVDGGKVPYLYLPN